MLRRYGPRRQTDFVRPPSMEDVEGQFPSCWTVYTREILCGILRKEWGMYLKRREAKSDIIYR